MDYQNNYIDLILGVSLSLQQGEGLSINTSERNLEFAQIVAQKASEITLVPVSIVLIEEGSVKDVFSVTPVDHDLVAETSTQRVLLRLEDASIVEEFPKATIEEIAANIPLLQAVGNLGSPQLSKEVAPWATIPVPSPFWSKTIFSGKEPIDDMWKLFASLLFLDSSNFPNSYINHLKKMNEILKRMYTLGQEHFHIYDGKTDIYIKLIPNSIPRHKLTLLENGRAFMPTLFNHGISMVVDSSFTHGTIHASRPFLILGTWVEGVSLTFFEGKVVDFHASKGKKALEIALNIDDGANKIGLVSLIEEKTELSPIIHYYGSPSIDEAITSYISLGMGESNHLKELEVYEDESELREKTGLNVSLLKGRIPFGSAHLNVDMGEGEKLYPIMVNGKFIF